MNKILYNVTVNIDHQIHDEWKQWMIEKHIPDVMATGKFIRYQFQRILEGQNETGVTYAIQYLAPNMQAYQEYVDQYASVLQTEHTQRYNGRFGAFRTLMEVIDMTD